MAQGEGEKDRAEGQKRIAAPRPIFKLTVQEKPHFQLPRERRPEASEPSSSEGLSVVIQPERPEFPLGGPLAFEVTLKNVGEKAFRLAKPDLLGGNLKLVLANQKTATQWSAELPESAESETASVTLEPGRSVRYTLLVAGVPDPRIPRPRPIPLPMPQPEKQPAEEQPAEKPAAAKDVIAPGRPIVRPFPIGDRLPCGTGSFRASLFLEFTDAVKKGKEGDAAARLWTGKLASGTVAFEIVKAAGSPSNRPQDARRAGDREAP